LGAAHDHSGPCQRLHGTCIECGHRARVRHGGAAEGGGSAANRRLGHGMTKRGSRLGCRAGGGGCRVYRTVARHEGAGGGPTRWRLEAAVNSGGRRWSAASLGARGGKVIDESGRK
jgi:hypothetical protein